MNIGKLRLLLALGCLCGSSSASAEVRLHHAKASDAPDLKVHVTRQGPWSPVGPVDALVLNPQGDLLGDAFPRWASSNQGVAAAWKRADGSAVFAIGTEAGWAASSVPAESNIQSPVPLNVQQRWLLAWQTDDLRIQWWQGLDQPPEDLADGQFLAALGGQTSGNFLLVTDAGDLVLETVVFAVILPHDILEPLARTRTELGSLGLPAVGDREASLRLARLAAAADVRVHDLGAETRVLTWWTPDDELNYLEVTDDGPVMPVSTLAPSGRARRPQGLIKRALKDVAERN